MTIQQLDYIVAVEQHRHFANAAEACCVTQPTLSMMIQKLEDELGAKIFDRSSHPVKPTEIGMRIIDQARISLQQFRQVREIVENEQNIVKGSFKLGVIPTIARYLVPELVRWQTDDHNEMELIIKENTTEVLISELMKGTIDGGLMAGPLHHQYLVEYPIYYEKFYAYVSPNDDAYNEREIDIHQVDISNLWLLENVHCFRGQIERLCQMKKNIPESKSSVRYEAGSIDTLISIVDCNRGITVIPEMSAMGLPEEKQDNLRPFKNMTAVREVSLVVNKEYIRHTMLNIVLGMIRRSVPKSMQDEEMKKFTVEL